MRCEIRHRRVKPTVTVEGQAESEGSFFSFSLIYGLNIWYNDKERQQIACLLRAVNSVRESATFTR